MSDSSRRTQSIADVDLPKLEGAARWPDHRLTDLLGIEHPIVLSPMAGLGTVELAAAVCRAGGLGSLGCAGMPPDVVTQVIRRQRALVQCPINVNFFCHAPTRVDHTRDAAWRDLLAPYYREFGIDPLAQPRPIDMPSFSDVQCAAIEETRPEVVSFHFGIPEPALVARVKAAGCLIFASATTVAEARWLEAHGADVVIAQGLEAGGHRATFLATNGANEPSLQSGTLALLPQVADAVDVPVIAAGGIADARGIAAAFALGAAGVQIGTAYLLCDEAATPALYRDALQRADANATLLTNVFTGRPARALANRLIREIGPFHATMPDFPLPMAALAALRTKAEQQGSCDFTPLWAGQSAGLARAMPAAVLTRALANEALAWLSDS